MIYRNRNSILAFKHLAPPKGILRRLFSEFFKARRIKCVSELSRETAVRYVEWRSCVNLLGGMFRPTAASTINRELQALRRMAREAERRGIIPDGRLWDGVRAAAGCANARRILSAHEQIALLEGLRGKPRIYSSALLMLSTGKKPGAIERPDSFRVFMSRHAGISPSTLRNSFAASRLLAGAPIEEVSEALGHCRAGFTKELYGDFVPRGTLGSGILAGEARELASLLDGGCLGGGIGINSGALPDFKDFRGLMAWSRRRDPVLLLIPANDFESELWIAWEHARRQHFDPSKRKSHLGYMCLIAKRELRKAALGRYQAISQSRYFYGKDGDVRHRMEDFSILEM